MRDHETCEAEINRALARGQDGRAEYLQTRCEQLHPEAHLPAEEPPPTGSNERTLA